MTSTDKELIERFKALDAKATPGEWWIEEHDGELYADPPNPAVQIVTGQDGDFIGELDSDNDQQLVCALRNDALPLINRLTAQIEALQAEVERLRESENFLSALMSAGVDCWDGYETAIEMMEGQQ